MKIDGLTPSEPSGAGRSRRWPIVAALVALSSVALCIKAIIPLQPGLLLFASTAVFVVPGVVLAWLLYEPAPGRGFAAWVVGPVWGYGLSSLVLLALWTAGVRGSVLLGAPLIGCLIAGLAGGWLRGVLAPPAFGRADLVVVLFLLVSVPAIVGLPFAHVAEPVPAGRAYRAYFTADMIWRMAVVAEVSKGDVPPRNPFLRGEPLNYYWLPHLLTAVQYRNVPRHISMEQVLLVNSVALGLAFILFLFGFVRHWVESPLAAAAGCLGALVFTSFEGLERLVVFWQRGIRLSAVTDLNIDAVTRWFYQSLPIDGLQRLLWYQPHHSTGYALGLSAVLVLFQCRGRLTPRLLAFCGSLLGATLLFSTFASIMLTLMVAVTAAILLAGQRRWGAFAIGAVAGAIPLALAVMIARSLRYVDLSGPSLVRVLVNPMAVENVWLSLLLSFGPMLILGAAGAVLVIARRQVWRFLGIAAIVLVSFAFYFFVDVRDHQYVYVGWRAGHFLFVALAVLVGYALQELWRTGGRTRTATISATVVLALLSLPTFAIDVYNTQDITNYNPNDKNSWTLVLTPDELAAYAWIRASTSPDALVQFEPHAREGRRWADVPAFAERRLSAGLPISMVPLAKYQEASGKVMALYQAHDPDTAFHLAARLGIDYLIVGPQERKMFPDFEATLRSGPNRFREAFRSGDVSVFMLEGGG
jgi:hypothetical protein